jgi:hypothetical protein
MTSQPLVKAFTTLPKSFPFIRIVFLDEFADEELAIHAHHMSYAGYHLNMETGTWECFSIYSLASPSVSARQGVDIPIVNCF